MQYLPPWPLSLPWQGPARCRPGAARRRRAASTIPLSRGGLVAHFQATHDGVAHHVQTLVLGGRNDGLFFKATEYRRALQDHAPVGRHLDRDAAANGEHVQHGLAFDRGLAQIDFTTGHDDVDIAATEALRRYAPHEAAQD